MIQMINIFIILSSFNVFYLKGDIVADVKSCRERERLIQNEKGDLYKLIDATLGQKLTLQCHYCNENDDARPKIWYKIDNFGESAPHEVRLDMKNQAKDNRIHINKEHSLIIHNFSAEDTGLYYCKRYEGESEDEEKYNYLVDLIFEENVTSMETGNFTDWRKYYEEYFVPINILFSQSEGSEFKHLRNDLNLEMEMVTEWDPWSICQVCGRPKNEGIRKKTGFCRIKLHQKNKTVSSEKLNLNEKFLINVDVIACRSQILGRLVPGISNRTRIVPNFIQVQACEGTCNPDAEGLGKGWKTGKTAAFKYRKTVVLEENSHLTLICPESTFDNAVIWKRNGKVLKAGESITPPNPEEEPRLIVDTFNTLYLVGVKESEEGNYTCQVDDIRMQQTVVYVISKSRLLTQAFVRHMMYLCLILSLTLPCYCVGIIIACHKRRTFKGYQELKEIEAEKHKNPGYIKFP